MANIVDEARRCARLTDYRGPIIRESLAKFDKSNGISAPWNGTADTAQCLDFVGGGILFAIGTSDGVVGCVSGLVDEEGLLVLLIDESRCGRNVLHLRRIGLGHLSQVESNRATRHDCGRMIVADAKRRD